MGYTGSQQEAEDRRSAANASSAAATATDTAKLTNVSDLATKMATPKRFWHMPTSH